MEYSPECPSMHASALCSETESIDVAHTFMLGRFTNYVHILSRHSPTLSSSPPLSPSLPAPLSHTQTIQPNEKYTATPGHFLLKVH